MSCWLELKNALVAYGVDCWETPAQEKLEKEILAEVIQSSRNLRITNSLYDTAFVLDGKLGARASMVMSIWEAASEQLLVTEAGGVVTDFQGKPLDFRVNESTYTRSFEIMVGNPLLHTQLLKAVQRAYRKI